MNLSEIYELSAKIKKIEDIKFTGEKKMRVKVELLICGHKNLCIQCQEKTTLKVKKNKRQQIE